MASYVGKEDCKYCGGKKTVSRYDDGGSFCFHANCNKVEPPQKDYEEVTVSETAEPTKTFRQLVGEHKPLTARKISQATCEKFDYQIGSIFGKPCHIMNHRDASRKVIAQKYRFADKSMFWQGDSKNAYFFGKHLWKPNEKLSIVITEGELDALSIAEIQDCKWPVVSLLKGAGSAKKSCQEEMEWLAGFKDIILFLDNDDAGRKSVESCVGLFPPGKVRVVHIDMKDASDMLVAGKTKELQQAIWNAEEYRPDGIITTKDVTIDTLLEPEKRGFSLPYPELNNMTRGLHKERLVLVAAAPGTGKSSLVKEIGLHLNKKHGLKVGNIFLEESTKQSVLSYIALDNNIPYYQLAEDPSRIPKEKFIESYNQFQNMFYYDHFGSMTTNNLLRKIEYLTVASEVDFILLDHISMVISGQKSSREGERKDLDILMTKLRSLIQRTGVGIMAIVHIKRKADSEAAEGGQLRLSDLRGSAALEQLSDFVLGLERDQQGEDKTSMRLRVLKNRLTGKTGEADLIEYNPATGRLNLKEELF